MSKSGSPRRRPTASRPELVRENPVRKKPLPKKTGRTPHPSRIPTPNAPPPKPSLRRHLAPQPAPLPLLRDGFFFRSTDRALTTKRLGEIAELAFSFKAYNLGFGVSKPYGDSERYDVILDSRDLNVRPSSDSLLLSR